VPAQERHRALGIQQAVALTRHLGQEARALRRRRGVSQARLARAIGVSRQWIGDLELGGLRTVDLRSVSLLFAALGHRVVVKAYPTGQGLRDAGQARLIERFDARLSPLWRRQPEAVMPQPGDLRAWDVLLRGPVMVGVEAETRPTDLQAVIRAMAAKLRDSGADRMILLLLSSHANRAVVARHVAMMRQAFPLDTRATLAALAAGRDPGANGLVML
jgi:transcriptional regulator with XRE-family HTH domain